jgi:hypothetical protein
MHLPQESISGFAVRFGLSRVGETMLRRFDGRRVLEGPYLKYALHERLRIVSVTLSLTCRPTSTTVQVCHAPPSPTRCTAPVPYPASTASRAVPKASTDTASQNGGFTRDSAMKHRPTPPFRLDVARRGPAIDGDGDQTG